MTERDEEGRPSQWVTEVEPEYDINERDNWEALDEWESALCPQCKQLRSICEDPNATQYPQLYICWATAAQQVATRMFTKKHEKATPDGSGYLPTDGRMIWTTSEDLTPEADWLG